MISSLSDKLQDTLFQLTRYTVYIHIHDNMHDERSGRNVEDGSSAHVPNRRKCSCKECRKLGSMHNENWHYPVL